MTELDIFIIIVLTIVIVIYFNQYVNPFEHLVGAETITNPLPTLTGSYDTSGLTITNVNATGNSTITGNETIGSTGSASNILLNNSLKITTGWTGYTAKSGENAEISNDTNAFKALMLVGNRSAGDGKIRQVGVWDKLTVNGDLAVTANSAIGGTASNVLLNNSLKFTNAFTGFPDNTTYGSEISNDINSYKTLMIVGNKSAGGSRQVGIWDKLTVNGDLVVTGTITGSNASTTQGVTAPPVLMFDGTPGNYVHYQMFESSPDLGSHLLWGNIKGKDDLWIVMAGYKLILYRDINYGGTSITSDNTNGTTPLKLILPASGTINYLANSTGSLKIFNKSGVVI